MAGHFPWCRTPCPGGTRDAELEWPPRAMYEHRGPLRIIESGGYKASVWIQDDAADGPGVALIVGARVAAGFCRLNADAAIRYGRAIIEEALKVGGGDGRSVAQRETAAAILRALNEHDRAPQRREP